MFNHHFIHRFIAQTLFTTLFFAFVSVSGIHSRPVLASVGQSVESQLSTVVREDDPAPGELGGTYSKIVSYSISDSGDVAFSASLSNSQTSSAIFLKSGDVTRPILRAGDNAPNGAKFKSFGELDITNEQHLVFQAELEGGTASEGIFLWIADSVTAIALAGDKSSKGLTYQSFAQPTIIFFGGSSKDEIAFVATFKKGGKAIMVQDRFPLGAVLVTGERLSLSSDEIIDDFTIGPWGAITFTCVAEAHRIGSEKRYKRLILVGGGFLAYDDTLIEGGKLKGFGRIKRILPQSATLFQKSLVAVDFKGGVRGLVSDDGGFVGVFARTGDVAPEVAGEMIRSLEPPVSNSTATVFATPENPAKRGVVAAVALSSGRLALQFWNFTTNKTRLFLIDGRADDGQGPVLRDFSPLRLTNRGKLLLKGTTEEGGVVRQGLFTLDKLFES